MPLETHRDLAFGVKQWIWLSRSMICRVGFRNRSGMDYEARFNVLPSPYQPTSQKGMDVCTAATIFTICQFPGARLRSWRRMFCYRYDLVLCRKLTPCPYGRSVRM